MQGVDNIYTQHEPYITAVLLDQLIKGKLRDSQWPACPIPSVEPRYAHWTKFIMRLKEWIRKLNINTIHALV